MSFVLDSPSERIDLGDPLEVLAALADVVRAAGRVEYPALFGISVTNEEPISDAYLTEVRAQARLLLSSSDAVLSHRARALLDRLLVGSGE